MIIIDIIKSHEEEEEEDEWGVGTELLLTLIL
jgi:hypothetical protein